MIFDKRIILQRRDPQTNMFREWRQLHARINKTQRGNEISAGGSRRSVMSLTFEVRYVSALREVFLRFQDFRIIYDGAVFVIRDYDDFMERHRTVRLEGECVGERQDND